jgi:hypothetical protein
MAKIKQISRSLVITCLCFAMIIAFWLTSGFFTQAHLNNLFNNSNDNINGDNRSYPVIVQTAQMENLSVNITDDRLTRKDVHFNNSVKEYTEGDIINSTKPIEQVNVREWAQDDIWTDGTPSWTFGSCDCDRLRILKYMLPTGDDKQKKRINYVMEIIAWDYKFYTVNEMWNYCIKRNFDMNSSI